MPKNKKIEESSSDSEDEKNIEQSSVSSSESEAESDDDKVMKKTTTTSSKSDSDSDSSSPSSESESSESESEEDVKKSTTTTTTTKTTTTSTKPKNRTIEDDEDDSDESDDDDNAMMDSRSWNDDFLRLLPMLSNKDKSLYDKDLRFFSEEQRQKDLESLKQSSLAKNKDKKKEITLRQIEKDKILASMDKDQYEGSDDDQEDDDEDDEDMPARPQSFDDMPYVKQQEHLKNAFKMAMADDDENDGDNADQDSDEEDDGELLKKRKRTEEEEERENEEFEEFKKRVTLNKDEDSALAIEDYWKSKKIDNEDEKFLRDYIVGQKWMSDSTKLPTYEEIIDEIDRDREDLDRQDNFEHSFNFRFEEPGSSVLITNPRNPGDSIRRKESKRKAKRDRKKERKEEEREKQEAVLKRLKNEKKKEILEKVKEIHGITGSTALDMDPESIRSMDPEIMIKELVESKSKKRQKHEQAEQDNEEGAGDYEGEEGDGQMALDDYMDSGYFDEDDDGEEWSEERLLKEKKELEAMLDNYYGVDYQDIIDGDTPVRFKYVNVDSNDYGLSLDDILSKDDNELEKVAPLHKLAPYYNEAMQYQKRQVKKNTNSKYQTWSNKTFTLKGTNRPLFRKPAAVKKVATGAPSTTSSATSPSAAAATESAFQLDKKKRKSKNKNILKQ
ncbi:hypothetical protein SAMD00019534_039120 [Acytostelium subglobosum LB1]|uniref:hypothetical protein n=1 Tax=Acytostelium subglobosum LB1 TaxID=1410327 RepID=UPI0006449EC8|nr:hypothetical protein SAMD00019534_039120 [Acytostelium subglobosum LB1]GAM20737.1 hypothetical protein SAMD00019534_039120 [Acytostelium subglobosum LB1]|eukprot:XP_012755871.1 hypothetical protein SAMD00019534_039120 [Acytostelium subglobosum LB1]